MSNYILLENSTPLLAEDGTPLLLEGGDKVPYATPVDVRNIFGIQNTNTWADLDNNGDSNVIDARIISTIALAQAHINDMLRGGVYQIPFSPVPTTIKYLCARIAGVMLHDARGYSESGGGDLPDPLGFHRKHSHDMLTKIKAGIIRLDAPRRMNAPHVIK